MTACCNPGHIWFSIFNPLSLSLLQVAEKFKDYNFIIGKRKERETERQRERETERQRERES